MTTQVLLASTAFGLATATAALDSGVFEPCSRRILVITCNTRMPEGSAPMQDIAGVPDLVRRFDAVYDYNATIEPQHPSMWHPRGADLPLWERHFRVLWDLGADDLHLIVESIQVNPAQALCRILGDARIDVYADGLMSYGPTRNALPEMIASRVERMLHLDLVPGLTPLLLSEQHVTHIVIPTECFRAVAKTMVADGVAVRTDDRVALIVGQYLADGEILSEREELDLYAAMILSCADAGYASLAFKPHPSAGAIQLARLRDVARSCGVRLAVADGRELAEACFERGGVELVVGCFSTALLTALHIYGLPVARLGTELILERLTPFHNSNRIPVTLVDALVPDISGLTDSASHPHRSTRVNLTELVVAVAYAMQPQRLAARRSQAAAFLADHYESHARYFKRRRLSLLGLPGGVPPKPPSPTSPPRRGLRRFVRRARRALGRRLLGAPRRAPGVDKPRSTQP